MQNHRNRPRDRGESRVQRCEISADIVVWSVACVKAGVSSYESRGEYAPGCTDLANPARGGGDRSRGLSWRASLTSTITAEQCKMRAIGFRVDYPLAYSRCVQARRRLLPADRAPVPRCTAQKARCRAVLSHPSSFRYAVSGCSAAVHPAQPAEAVRSGSAPQHTPLKRAPPKPPSTAPRGGL